MPRGWLLIGLVTVLMFGAVVLTFLALDHVRTRPPEGVVAPVPTFTQPSQQAPSPTPTESAVATASFDRSQERFLAVSAGTLWRGVAGECGSVAPSLERSTDDGQTWSDVTPRYLGIGQLVALNPFADGQAEIIALMGDGCQVQALRTFTQGQFWEPYANVLAASQYVDPANSGSIVRPGSPIAAPCADARSLHSTGSALATVCDGAAYILGQDSEWRALPATKVAALNFDGNEIVIAHVSDECNGIAITSGGADPVGVLDELRCAESSDAAGPIAIAASGEDTLVWSGATIAVSTR